MAKETSGPEARGPQPTIAELRRTARAVSVLAMTSELPWPLNTGGHLRTYHLLRALAVRFRVRLVVPVTAAEQEEAVSQLSQAGLEVLPVPVGPRRAWQETLRMAGAALRGEPYVLYRRHNRAAVRGILRHEMRSDPPDVLYLDHLDSLALWPGRPPLPFVIDLHNVYSTLVNRTATERRGLVRFYLRREARLLDKVERRAAGLAGALFAVSDEEANHFRSLGGRGVHVVPNGVDCAAYAALPCGRNSADPLLLYVGAMSWAPNVAAARYLATDVLPAVRQRFPTARLRIVGRGPTPDVWALRSIPGVEVTGTVGSIVPHLEQASVLAVPLEAGGGTRLKILEAFAAGLPVVSTPVGCEGLRVRHGEHLVVAERGCFAGGLIALLADARTGHKLADRARTLVSEDYDWRAVGITASRAVAELGRGGQAGLSSGRTLAYLSK